MGDRFWSMVELCWHIGINCLLFFIYTGLLYHWRLWYTTGYNKCWKEIWQTMNGHLKNFLRYLWNHLSLFTKDKCSEYLETKHQLNRVIKLIKVLRYKWKSIIDYMKERFTLWYFATDRISNELWNKDWVLTRQEQCE